MNHQITFAGANMKGFAYLTKENSGFESTSSENWLLIYSDFE